MCSNHFLWVENFVSDPLEQWFQKCQVMKITWGSSSYTDSQDQSGKKKLLINSLDDCFDKKTSIAAYFFSLAFWLVLIQHQLQYCAKYVFKRMAIALLYHSDYTEGKSYVFLNLLFCRLQFYYGHTLLS